MNSPNIPDDAFDEEALRPPEFICRPDPRTLNLANFDVNTRKLSVVTPVTQHGAIARFKLNSTTPQAVRVHFETAKNLYLYAWFVFRFYPVAEQQALATLEFALRERLPDFVLQYKKLRGGDYQPGLGALLRHAIEQKIIRNELFKGRQIWAMERARRRYESQKIEEWMRDRLQEVVHNDSDIKITEEDSNHDWLQDFLDVIPSIRNDYAHGSGSLRHSVLHTFEVVTEIINQIFPLPPHE